MPGHVKMGKAGEPDPDPSEYLIVSMDMKREDQMKPYDSKKSYWIPDNQGGFIEAMLEENDGKNAKVIVKGYEVCCLDLKKYLRWEWFICYKNFFQDVFLFFRKELSNLTKLDRSIHPSSRSVKTWLISLSLMMLLSIGI